MSITIIISKAAIETYCWIICSEGLPSWKLPMCSLIFEKGLLENRLKNMCDYEWSCCMYNLVPIYLLLSRTPTYQVSTVHAHADNVVWIFICCSYLKEGDVFTTRHTQYEPEWKFKNNNNYRNTQSLRYNIAWTVCRNSFGNFFSRPFEFFSLSSAILRKTYLRNERSVYILRFSLKAC